MIVDTVADNITKLPKLRDVHHKLLGLYASCGGCVLASPVPFYVLRDGRVFDGKRGSLQATRPDIRCQQTDIFDELMIIADGLASDRYNTFELQVFEDMSQHLLNSLASSEESLAPYHDQPHWAPVGIS